MGIYALLFGSVAALYRKRGWFSPLTGGGAVALCMGLELVVGTFLVLHGYPLERTFDPVAVSLYAAVSAFLTFLVSSFFLPKVDPSKIPKTSRFPYRVFGYFLIILAPVLIVLEIWGEVSSKASSATSSSSSAFVPLAIMFIIVIISCFKIARQQRAAANRWKLLLGNLPPILYLRSFQAERKTPAATTGFWSGSRTPAQLDEILGQAVEKLGVCVALGDPDDYLPTPGAFKVYSSNERWQDYIKRLMQVARAVFIVEGATPGLQWELAQVRSAFEPQRVFLLTAPAGYRKVYRKKNKRSLWDVFKPILQQAGFRDPGEDPGPGSIVMFDPDWTSRVLARSLKGVAAYRSVFEKYLLPSKEAFDFKVISDLLFSGIVEEDGAVTGMRWSKRLGLAASGLACVGMSVALAPTVLGPMLGHGPPASDAHETAAHAGTRAPQHIIYQGTPLAYTVDLPVDWKQMKPPQTFWNLFFQWGKTACFGTIVEPADTLPAEVDSQTYVRTILENVARNSDVPIRVLLQERRTFAGQEWEFIRFAWQRQKLAFTSSVAVCVRNEASYQLNGFTVNPESDNSRIEAAFDGFRFPANTAGNKEGSPHYY